jgi:hypothetical protein
MGPVRRQLIAYGLMVSPAMAGICETARPRYQAVVGPVTMFGELVHFLLWGGGWALVLGVIAGFYFRKAIVLSAVLLVSLIMAVPYIWPLDPVNRQLAMTEGCVGAPTLVIGVLGAVCLACLAGILLKRKEVR